MKVIGLTGPTGAGKGEVGRMLAQKGALIIDTDRIAREVVAPGQPCLAELAAAFGEDILQKDGTLDRAALAGKAFAFPETAAMLNRITHPHIIARSLDILKSGTAAVGVIDAPLLFESGMDSLCDTTVAVLAPAVMRKRRIMARDGIDETRALERMNAQPDEEFYRTRAAHILVNDGDTAALHDAVNAWFAAVAREEEP